MGTMMRIGIIRCSVAKSLRTENCVNLQQWPGSQQVALWLETSSSGSEAQCGSAGCA